MEYTACKDGPYGLFTIAAEGVSFTALGDAIRGWCVLAKNRGEHLEGPPH